MTRNWVIGIDPGLSYDYTAIALVERSQQWHARNLAGTLAREDVHHVQYLYRWDLGTPYRQIISEIGVWMQEEDLRDACIVIDATGVGYEVAQLFLQAHRERRLGHFGPRPYVITPGRETTNRLVPKRELIGKLTTLMESDRLKIADELELGEQLRHEFRSLRIKPTPTGQDSYESAREKDHDDIVLAVALGCWFRHTLTQPRLLEPVKEELIAAT